MKRIKYIYKEMRIKSWLKNVFVLSPLVFSHEFFNVTELIQALLLTLAFCFVSSAIYVWNDINDVENDRKHEVKKNRPIASGNLSIPAGWVLLCILAVAGCAMAFFVKKDALYYLLAYVVINLFYSKWLKTKAIIDCFCIAAGFVLRVMVGGTIVSEGISNWMFLTVLALALFMAFGKRRGELASYQGGETRDVLMVYDISFLDGIVFMCAGLSMVFYSLWSISKDTNLVYTVPVVLFIVLRYLLLVFKGEKEADPTSMILSDKTLLIAGLICGLMMFFMLYGTRIFR